MQLLLKPKLNNMEALRFPTLCESSDSLLSLEKRSVTRGFESHKQPGIADRIPPHFSFLVSAVFHYLGPAFAGSCSHT